MPSKKSEAAGAKRKAAEEANGHIQGALRGSVRR
jgi:hypothetical protein